MTNRVLLDRVRRAIDRIDALGIDGQAPLLIDPQVICEALQEVRCDLEDALMLPASFDKKDPDWREDDRRQCGKVAHLI